MGSLCLFSLRTNLPRLLAPGSVFWVTSTTPKAWSISFDRLLLVGRGKVSVAQSHLDALVSQQLPNGVQICTCHDQIARKSVPEIMKATIRDSCRFEGC